MMLLIGLTVGPKAANFSCQARNKENKKNDHLFYLSQLFPISGRVPSYRRICIATLSLISDKSISILQLQPLILKNLPLK